MYLYFLLLHIAALFGHRKARMLVRGQRQSLRRLKEQGLSDVIWFHAASSGEFEQARPIIERLRREHPQERILITFFSPSGYELRKDYTAADAVVYLPFATRWQARRFIQTVRPKTAVFVKYEFWPAYLRELKKNKIPTYLISAIFRPKQLFFRPWGKPYRKLLHHFTQLFVQDEASREVLGRYGINNVQVAGDTRFDRVQAIARAAKPIPQVQTFVTDRTQVIVAGSTWHPDEVLLARYLREHPQVQLVLVPHEPDEKRIEQIFQTFEGRMVRFSQATRLNLQASRVLVVDTIGLLSSIYQYGQVAYVGGGFGVGIHNTLEAAVWGIPVLFGPNHKRFREAVGLIDAGAALSVSNYNELAAGLDEALLRHNELGEDARQYIVSQPHAADIIYPQLFPTGKA